jgi:hypothetical protein
MQRKSTCLTSFIHKQLDQGEAFFCRFHYFLSYVSVLNVRMSLNIHPEKEKVKHLRFEDPFFSTLHLRNGGICTILYKEKECFTQYIFMENKT